jgi:hypothetical protein
VRTQSAVPLNVFFFFLTPSRRRCYISFTLYFVNEILEELHAFCTSAPVLLSLILFFIASKFADSLELGGKTNEAYTCIETCPNISVLCCGEVGFLTLIGL